MAEKVKIFIENLWQESFSTNTRITPEYVLEKIRGQRGNDGAKHFTTDEYPTKNQINYRFRKLNEKYGITAKQQLITEIMDNNLS